MPSKHRVSGLVNAGTICWQTRGTGYSIMPSTAANCSCNIVCTSGIWLARQESNLRDNHIGTFCSSQNLLVFADFSATPAMSCRCSALECIKQLGLRQPLHQWCISCSSQPFGCMQSSLSPCPGIFAISMLKCLFLLFQLIYFK